MSLVESAPIAATTSPSPSSSASPSVADGDSQEADRDSFRDGLSRAPNSAQQDYSVVMLVKTVGSLVGAPVMTFAWVKGIGLGGAALGLPYFLSAVSTCQPRFFFSLEKPLRHDVRSR